MTKYGKSPWIDRFPTSRVPAYPRQRGAIDDGGGDRRRRPDRLRDRVRLCRGRREGRARRGRADRPRQHRGGRRVDCRRSRASFVEVEKALGVRAARHAFQAWRRAALDFAALLRRLDIKCDLQPQTTWDVAITPEQVAALKREQKARRDAGLDAPLVNARAVKIGAGARGSGGVRDKGDAVLDPYRACLGLAAAAAARGARFFERSAVRTDHVRPQERRRLHGRRHDPRRPRRRRDRHADARSSSRSRAISGFAPRISR